MYAGSVAVSSGFGPLSSTFGSTFASGAASGLAPLWAATGVSTGAVAAGAGVAAALVWEAPPQAATDTRIKERRIAFMPLPVDYVNGLPEAMERRLHHPFAERGMRMDGHADVLEEGVHLERQHALADEVGRLGADDVETEDFVRFLVAHDLDEAIGLVHGHRTAERGKRE